MYTEPGAPKGFSLNHITSTRAHLSWCVPLITNGIILNYTVVYSNTTDTIPIIYSNNDTFHSSITNLNEDTLYNFTIYANTSAGAGNTSIVSIRTREDRKCYINFIV